MNTYQGYVKVSDSFFMSDQDDKIFFRHFDPDSVQLFWLNDIETFIDSFQNVKSINQLVIC